MGMTWDWLSIQSMAFGCGCHLALTGSSCCRPGFRLSDRLSFPSVRTKKVRKLALSATL